MALKMEETWRWYGPNDPVTLADVRQAGATGIVTALHEIPIGEVWPVEAIRERKSVVEAAGLTLSVIESIPVHEAIKSAGADRDRYIENWCQTVRNLGACGITRVAYNFMPVLDWTRTELAQKWADGSRALAFDRTDFIAFELHLLRRPGAEALYDAATRERAAARFAAMDEATRATLERTIVAGMPGRMVDAYTAAGFQAALDAYKEIDAAALRENLAYFLRAVVPVAAEEGVYLAIHPDDPPMPLLGLPRVVSNDADIRHVLAAVDDVHNGLTFCVGSYGSNAANNVEAMAEAHASRVHFVHLRNVRRTDAAGSFVESDHLDGEVDMFRVVRTFTRERARRVAEGWADAGLPFRPDHGHQMLDDLRDEKKTNPGYTAIGRLRGLAEIRGLQEAIVRVDAEAAAA